jgi:hypothetical protein
MLDQQVLAILRTSGGWNAQARARLAAFAESRRVPLEAVVASALRVAAGAAAGASGAMDAGSAGADARGRVCRKRLARLVCGGSRGVADGGGDGDDGRH